MVNTTALGCTRCELDHVALAEGVARVRDKIPRFRRVVFPDPFVPGGVAIGDSDGALHAPNRDDGAGLEAVGVVAEPGGWAEAAGFELEGGRWWCVEGVVCVFGGS